MKLGALSPPEVRARLRGTGLALSVRPIAVRVRSPLDSLAGQLHALYADYETIDAGEYCDVDVRMLPIGGARRWTRPQVQFVVDGVTPFDPFPLDHALPMFEWGVNWLFAHRMHSHLLLHAAVVERGGRALVMPAWPGSGKSTLAASLASRGWRLLSDEFGIVDLGDARLLPFARPIALKNESIAVMQAFDPGGYIGTAFPGTRKGTVAHARVPGESVRRGAEPARAAAIVFPDFRAGADVSVRPLDKPAAFLKLAGNAFNYEVVGEAAFRAVASIVRRCDCCILAYGDLAAAHAAIADLVARQDSRAAEVVP
jgi:HprK-related kinase A